MPSPSHQRILILDFGSQVTQLIARRLRETHVYCEIHPGDVERRVRARASAPGASSCRAATPACTTGVRRARRTAVWTLGVPVLGICYGMQTMAHQLGGKVELGQVREFGYAEVRARGHSALFRDIQDRAQRRGPRPARRVDEPRRQGRRDARRLQAIGSSDACAIAAMADESRALLRGAVPSRGHAHAAGQGDPRALRARDLRLRRTTGTCATTSSEAVASIRAKVGGDEVILGLSGGVDSSVAAALIHRAIGDAAHLRVRRPRPAAPERGDAGDGHVRAQPRRAR